MKQIDYLPMGTIVVLKNGFKKLMIFGRRQKHIESGEEYDYIACLYPEGNIKSNMSILFNEEDIQEVIHMGYSDEDEKRYKEKYLKAESKVS